MEPKDFKNPPPTERQKPVFPKKKESEAPRLIVPDPDCFEDFGEDPNRKPAGPDIYGLGPLIPDSMLSEEKVTPVSQADAVLSEEEDTTPNEHVTSLIASIVQRRKKQKRQMILLLILCFILFSLLIAGVIFATLYKPPVDEKLPFDPTREMGTLDADSDGIPDALTDEDSRLSSLPAELEFKRREGVYNFLVLGIDRAAHLADVIMIVNFDTKNSELHIASVPRDTYIEVHSNFHTLNAYFAAGYNRSEKKGEERFYDAIDMMKRFLEENLCIKIDRTVCIDTEGFRDIIDAVDGVDINVPFDMDYEDPEQDLYIHLKAGEQHLDGKKAEQFVRFRKAYLNGDIGRISAQQLFLTALAKKVMSDLTPKTIGEVLKEAYPHTMTDLDLLQCVFFGKEALFLDLSRITFSTFPGAPAVNPENGAGYYVMYADAAREIVNTQLNVYDKEISSDLFLSQCTSFTNGLDYIDRVFLNTEVRPETASAAEVETSPVDIPLR